MTDVDEFRRMEHARALKQKMLDQIRIERIRLVEQESLLISEIIAIDNKIANAIPGGICHS